MRLLTAVATLFAAMASVAATVCYVGGDNGAWTTAANWSPPAVPTASDDVVISGRTVKAASAIAVRSLAIVGAEASLSLGGAALAPQTIATIAGDLAISNGATLSVFAGALADRSVFAGREAATAAIYSNATVVAVGGTLSVSVGATVHPENDPVTGTPVFFKVGNFRLAESGTVSAVSRGWNLQSFTTNALTALPVGYKPRWYMRNWYCTYAFGAGVDYGCSAGYGGASEKQKDVAEPAAKSPGDGKPSPVMPWTSTWRSGEAYGSAYAPFLSGSPGGHWGSGHSRGSGTIAIFATNEVSIAGTLDANGAPYPSYVFLSGASGGSVWVCGKSVVLAETSVLRAEGGKTLGYAYPTGSGGGGGRISVCIGLTQAEIDELADGREALSGDFYAEPLVSRGLVSVTGGPDTNEVHRGNAGTATCVYSLDGQYVLKVRGAPVEAISQNVAYGTALVPTNAPAVFVADACGRDPFCPDGLVRRCLGWVVSNATEEVARGTTARAELHLDPKGEMYVLTWLWDEPVPFSTFGIDRPGCGTVAVNGATYGESFRYAAGGPDALTAMPNTDCRFLGWMGLPSGFTTNVTVFAPAETGLVVTALFEPIAATGETKTWLGAVDDDWGAADNWSPVGVPTLKDDVVIANRNCKVSSCAVAHSITVAAGRTFSVFSSSTDAAKKPVADNSDSRRHRHLFVAGDFTVAGNVVIGGEDAQYTNLSLRVGGDLRLTGAAKMAVYPVPLDESIASTPTNLYRAASVFSVGGSVVLEDASMIYPWCDVYTGTAVRFEVASNLTVAAGAKIDAEGRGWDWRVREGGGDPQGAFTHRYTAGKDTTTVYETRSLGAGYSYTVGAGHGNCGNWNWKRHATYGHEYGYASAPFLPGSASGSYNSGHPVKAGGGVVWFKCGRKITLNGTVVADAAPNSFYSGGAGGSVWLLARGMGAGPAASISAHGGCTADSQHYSSAGAGGRVCIALGVADADVEALAVGGRPEALSYEDGTDLLPIDVCGGAEGTKNGMYEVRYAPTGTVSFVKGPYADKSLTVAADVLAGAPSPAYGITPVMVGEVLTVCASADGYGADPSDPDSTRWTCAGYVVSNATAQLATGTEARFAFTMPNEDVFVTWSWTNRESAVIVDVPQGAAYGSVLADGEACEPGGKIWLPTEARLSLTAVPTNDCEFLYWAGDFPFGHARDNPLTLSAASGLRLRPVFRRSEPPTVRVWRKSGSVPGDFLDETLWSGGNIPGLADDIVITQGVCQAANNNYVGAKSVVVSGSGVRFLIGSRLGVPSARFADAEDRAAGYLFPSTVSELADEIGLVIANGVTVSAGAQLGIGAPNAARAAHGRLEAANVRLSDDSELLVTAGAVGGRFSFASGAGFVNVAGSFAVDDMAVYRPVSDPWTGGSVKATVGSFSLASNATVYAAGMGFVRRQSDALSLGLGQGYDYVIGAGYGGRGEWIGAYDAYKDAFGVSYGWPLAPIHPGSPNGGYNFPYMAGGGLVRIHANGGMSLSGLVTAAAQERSWSQTRFFGGASGGGIWLTARNFSFGSGATLDAHGGYSTYSSAGGGGRIVVGQYAGEAIINRFAAYGCSPLHPARSVEAFTSRYPGVAVNVSGGSLYTDKESEAHHLYVRQSGEDGTFRYVSPNGTLFAVGGPDMKVGPSPVRPPVRPPEDYTKWTLAQIRAGVADMGGEVLVSYPEAGFPLVSNVLGITSFDNYVVGKKRNDRTRIFVVPAAYYKRVKLLVGVDPDASKDRVFTVRFTRYNDAEGYTGRCFDGMSNTEVDFDTAEKKQVGDKWELTIPVDLGNIADLVTGDDMFGTWANNQIRPSAWRVKKDLGNYLDFEVLSRLSKLRASQYDRRMQPDYSYKSGITVYGATLVKAGTEFQIVEAQRGNVFTVDETPETSVRVKPLKPGEFRLDWTIRDVDGQQVGAGSRDIDGETLVTVGLAQPQLGWYSLDYALYDCGERLLTHAATFALLDHDTRTTGTGEGPYGSWSYGGSHYNLRYVSEYGPLFEKAGLRRCQGVEKTDGHSHRLSPPAISWPSGDMSDAERIAKIREQREANPAVTMFMIFHESAPWSYQQAWELTGQVVPDPTTWGAAGWRVMDPTPEGYEQAWIDRTNRHVMANTRAKLLRENFPEIKITLGNSLACTELIAETIRDGFPEEYADYMGIESVVRTQMPEREGDMCIQMADPMVQVARHFGYDSWKPNAAWESCYRIDSLIGEERQAAWYVRDILLQQAWRFPDIFIGIITDCGNAYNGGFWGASGLCHRAPYAYPKKCYVGIAVATRLLDGVVATRPIPTGDECVYVHEYERQDGTHVYGIWTSRGEAEVELATQGVMSFVDFYGRPFTPQSSTLNPQLSTLTAGEFVRYAVAAPGGSVVSANVTGRAYPDDTLPPDVQLVQATDDVSHWKLAETTNATMEITTGPYMPYRTKGAYELRGVVDEERGPCLELELVDPNYDLPSVMGEYAEVLLDVPVPLTNSPASVGAWVKGNSGWGQFYWILEGTDKKRHYSCGQGASADIFDYEGRVSICYSGWRFLSMPIDDRSSIRNTSTDSIGSLWRGGSCRGAMKLVGFAFSAMNRPQFLAERKPHEQKIRIGGIFAAEYGISE